MRTTHEPEHFLDLERLGSPIRRTWDARATLEALSPGAAQGQSLYARRDLLGLGDRPRIDDPQMWMVQRTDILPADNHTYVLDLHWLGFFAGHAKLNYKK